MPVATEASGCVVFDDALVGWQRCCSACGAAVPDDRIRGESLVVEALGLEVHVSACARCAQRWEQVKPRLLALLQERYREGEE